MSAEPETRLAQRRTINKIISLTTTLLWLKYYPAPSFVMLCQVTKIFHKFPKIFQPTSPTEAAAVMFVFLQVFLFFSFSPFSGILISFLNVSRIFTAALSPSSKHNSLNIYLTRKRSQDNISRASHNIMI